MVNPIHGEKLLFKVVLKLSSEHDHTCNSDPYIIIGMCYISTGYVIGTWLNCWFCLG